MAMYLNSDNGFSLVTVTLMLANCKVSSTNPNPCLLSTPLVIHTSDVWGYRFLENEYPYVCLANTGRMIFSVKAASDVHISISDDQETSDDIEV